MAAVKVQGYIEFTVTERSPEKVTSVMPIQPGIRNPFGVVHAGAMFCSANCEVLGANHRIRATYLFRGRAPNLFVRPFSAITTEEIESRRFLWEKAMCQSSLN